MYDNDWVKNYLGQKNIFRLLPMQKDILDIGLLSGESILLSSPTTSGKTFMADMLINYYSEKISEENKPIIYVIPFVAAARQRAVNLYRTNKKLRIVSAAKTVGLVGGIDFEGIGEIEWIKEIDYEKGATLVFDKLAYMPISQLHMIDRELFWRTLFSLDQTIFIRRRLSLKDYIKFISKYKEYKMLSRKYGFLRYRSGDISHETLEYMRDKIKKIFSKFAQCISSIMKGHENLKEIMLDDIILDDIKIRFDFLITKNPKKFLNNLNFIANNNYDCFLTNKIVYKDPLLNADVLVTTPELLDKYLRRHDWFFRNTKILILDELHTLGDETRGGTLDKVIAWIRTIANDQLQIFSMSATIRNVKELSEWLNARYIIYPNETRPVPLVEGVISAGSGNILWNKNEGYDFLSDVQACKWRFKKENIVFYLCNFIRKKYGKKGQTMVFTRSRPRCEYLARKYAKKIARDRGLDIKTYKNRDCWKVGVGYHNGALSFEERASVERLLEERKIHTIFCTTTLAIGLNIPAKLVIVETPEMPFVEVQIKRSLAKQMVGRAGRYGYDDIGYAVYLARNDKEAEEIYQNYIERDVEDTVSTLGNRQLTHTLSLTSNLGDKKFIKEVLKNTFYYKKIDVGINKQIENQIYKLRNMGLVTSNGSTISPTKAGDAMIKYFIDVENGIEILYGFQEFLGTISQRLWKLPMGALKNEAYIHRHISEIYIDMVNNMSELLSIAANDMSSNRLERDDFRAFVRLKCFGEQLIYRDFKLRYRDLEKMFNNFGRYFLFLRESTEHNELINIFENGLKTSVPYAYQWIIGGSKHFSYKKSVELARKIRNTRGLKNLLDNPFTFSHKLSRSEKFNFLNINSIVMQSSLNDVEKEELSNLDNLELRYILEKAIYRVHKLGSKERALIDTCKGAMT